MIGRSAFLMFLRGICMGTADIIPGVSGGTIALITGIYARLISGVDDTVTHGGAVFKKLLTGSVSGVKDELAQIDFALFVPLFLGIGFSFFSLSHLIHYLLENQTALLYAFFFGLIISSALFVFRTISVFNITTITAFLTGAVLAFIFVGMDPVGSNHSLAVVFFSGAVAICAMLLPGISGSFILVFLGQYDYMLSVLKDFRLTVILVFICGAAGGMITFTRLINHLLKYHRTVTLTFITGLMAGSLRLPYIKIKSVDYSLVPVVLLALFGVSVVSLLEHVFRERAENG